MRIQRDLHYLEGEGRIEEYPHIFVRPNVVLIYHWAQGSRAGSGRSIQGPVVVGVLYPALGDLVSSYPIPWVVRPHLRFVHTVPTYFVHTCSRGILLWV